MQKSSLKRLSILGLVLMAASAVTAAILPSAKSEDLPAGFTVTVRTGDGVASTASCRATNAVNSQACKDDTASDGVASGSTTFGGSDGATTLGA